MIKYSPEIPVAKNDGFENPTVRKALEIISQWTSLNQAEFNTREYLNKLADESISDSTNPTTTVKKINNQLSYVAVRKIQKQMAERIFVVTGGDISTSERAIIKKAYIRFLELSGYRDTWLDNTQMIRTGDQFITAGASDRYCSDGVGFPFKIVKKSITQLFFNPWVTSLVDRGDNKSVSQYVEIVFDGEWDEAIEIYPWIVENGGGKGLIPVDQDQWNMKKQTDDQKGFESDRRIQVARFIDESTKTMLYFAGATAVVGNDLSGEYFPNIDRFGNINKNIFQKYCFEKVNGLLNAGVLQATHKLSVLDGILQSIGYSYEMINMNAIKIISTGMSPETFRGEYNKALEAQLNLKEGVIYSKDNIGVQTTQANSIISEMLASLEQISRNFARLDIIIDDTLTDPQKTLGALELEQVSQSRGVRMLQAQNAQEEQRFHDFVSDWIIQNVEDENSTEISGLNASIYNKEGQEVVVNGRKMQDENGEDVIVNFTVGDLAKSIRENNLRFEIVPESGIKINEAISRRRAEQNLNRYASLGMNKMVLREMKRIQILNGESEVDIDLLESQQQEQEQQQQQQQQQQPPQPIKELQDENV